MRVSDAEAALAALAYAPTRHGSRACSSGSLDRTLITWCMEAMTTWRGWLARIRETITAALRQLRRLGLVELRRRTIHLLDVNGLEQLSSNWPPRASG